MNLSSTQIHALIQWVDLKAHEQLYRRAKLSDLTRDYRDTEAAQIIIKMLTDFMSNEARDIFVNKILEGANKV